MNIPRRTFLKGIVTTGGAMALGTTVLPPAVMADVADWPQEAFEAKTGEDALTALYGEEFVDKSAIAIKAPIIAENGQVVPIEVTANLEKIESITIIAEKNPVPLVAQFNFPDPENAIGWVKTRIKMAETSDVIVVVKADDKFYTAHRNVKVTIGGCGG